MLAVSHHSSSSLSTPFHGVMDESGTINPAALNAPLSTALPPTYLTQPSPRGTKRSRSPDTYGASGHDTESDDAQGNKRSRLKIGASPAPSSTTMSLATAMPHQPVQTPQVKTPQLPRASPTQPSPARSTSGSATKPAVVKALPTVRDHTTDQLGPEGDEYLPREVDQDGEMKVSKDGYPQESRKYKCRTFNVPNRGDKLFMLATECARVLGYRDSYLLFNKNRSLYKIIANQTEKDNLIHQEVLPYSYRSRQIAIVTARSMFRQFGSRLIESGRRVRDDYWEAKARKQGFTEEDAAGEKRPGAAKAREAAAAEANQHQLTAMPQAEVIYSNPGAGLDGQPPGLGPVSLAPLSMIHLQGEELARSSALGGIMRPRQELAGSPYIDRSQPSSAAEILSQAGQAAEYNKSLSGVRQHRSGYLNDYWKRPHEQPTTEAQAGASDSSTVAPQNLQSPQANVALSQHRVQQDQMSHPASQMITPAYPGYANQQNPLASPARSMYQPVPPTQLHQTSPSMGMGQRTPSFPGYNQSQMWPPPQPQPSPLSQSHMSGYGQQQQQQQQQQHHSPMPPPQMPQQSSLGYAQMNQMSNPAAFAGMNRSMYQPSPNQQQSQQYGMHSSSSGQQQPGMQGWATPGSAGSLPQNYGYQ